MRDARDLLPNLHSLAIGRAAALLALIFVVSGAVATPTMASAQATISWSGTVSMEDIHAEHLPGCGGAGWQFHTDWHVVDETVPLSDPDETGARSATIHLEPTSPGSFAFTSGSATCPSTNVQCAVTYTWSGMHAIDSVQDPVAVEMRLYLDSHRLAISPDYSSSAHDWALNASVTTAQHAPCDGNGTGDAPITQGYGLPRFQLAPLGFPERDDRVPIRITSSERLEVDGPYTAVGSPDISRTLNFGGMPFGSWFTALLTNCGFDQPGCDGSLPVQSFVDESSKMTENLVALVDGLPLDVGTSPGSGNPNPSSGPGGTGTPTCSAGSPSACPTNKFKLGSSHATRRGTIFRVTVPGPGTVSVAATKRTRPVSKHRESGGVVQLVVRPTTAGRRALERHSQIITSATVTFRPAGGLPRSVKARIKLIR